MLLRPDLCGLPRRGPPRAASPCVCERARCHQGLIARTKVRRQRLRISADHLGRATRHHATELHHDHVRAELEDQRDIVFHQDDRGVGHLVDPSQQRDERLGLALRDARRRLVEQEKPRAGQDDGGEVHHPPRPGRQLGRAMVPEALEAEGGDHLVDRGQLALLGAPRPGQAQRRREHSHLLAGVLTQEEHVEHRELRIEPAVLERTHHADPEPLFGQVLPEVDAVEANPSGLRLHEARDHVEGRRLARAVGPDQTHDGSGRGVEAHTAERVHAAEVHVQTLDAQVCRASGTGSRRGAGGQGRHCSAPFAASAGGGAVAVTGVSAASPALRRSRLRTTIVTTSPRRCSNSAKPPGR